MGTDPLSYMAFHRCAGFLRNKAGFTVKLGLSSLQVALQKPESASPPPTHTTPVFLPSLLSFLLSFPLSPRSHVTQAGLKLAI